MDFPSIRWPGEYLDDPAIKTSLSEAFSERLALLEHFGRLLNPIGSYMTQRYPKRAGSIASY